MGVSRFASEQATGFFGRVKVWASEELLATCSWPLLSPCLRVLFPLLLIFLGCGRYLPSFSLPCLGLGAGLWSFLLFFYFIKAGYKCALYYRLPPSSSFFDLKLSISRLQGWFVLPLLIMSKHAGLAACLTSPGLLSNMPSQGLLC